MFGVCLSLNYYKSKCLCKTNNPYSFFVDFLFENENFDSRLSSELNCENYDVHCISFMLEKTDYLLTILYISSSEIATEMVLLPNFYFLHFYVKNFFSHTAELV